MILKVKILNDNGKKFEISGLKYKFFDGFDEIKIEPLKILYRDNKEPEFTNDSGDIVKLTELFDYNDTPDPPQSAVYITMATLYDKVSGVSKIIGFVEAYLLNDFGQTIERY